MPPDKSPIIFTEELDLRGIPCPANAGRTLLRLECLSYGDILCVILDDGEPIENVPASVVEAGHEIVSKEQNGSAWRLYIRTC